MKTALLICLGVSACIAIVIAIWLFCMVIRRCRFAEIYQSPIRDQRFANALLTQVFGDKILKMPYLLRDEGVTSPRADTVFVCSGGVAVITILSGKGTFSAPEHGPWKQYTEDGCREIENLMETSHAYVSELAGLFMKESLFCPTIRRYVFLTDDHAHADFMSSDCVLPGNELIETLKDFRMDKRLSGKEQKELIRAIERNHMAIQQQSAARKAAQTVTVTEADDPMRTLVNSLTEESAETEDTAPAKVFTDIDAGAAPSAATQSTHTFLTSENGIREEDQDK
ncbi:MAG: hypothetical protein ACI3YK_05695 [Eubacteriales bacterium]